MSFAPGGFVPTGKLGSTPGSRGLGAIPIPVSSVASDYPNGCPMGFRRVFGVCQMDIPSTVGAWNTPVFPGAVVMAGRSRR